MTRIARYRNVLLALHAGTTGTVALAMLLLSIAPPLYLKSGMPANFGLVVHIIAYGILCIMAGTWLHIAGKTSYPALYAALYSSLYGLLIECIQYGVLYRSFEINDILINCCTAAVAIIPCRVILQYVPVYKKPAESECLISRLLR